MEQAQIDRFEAELARKIEGDVLFDEMSCLLYSTDASLYQIRPLGVVLPRSREDVVQAIRTAVKYRVPILPRGGGTSLAGQTVSPGLVVDCSKYLNRLLEFNQSERWVRVQPGIVLDNLNHGLAPHGLHFAPDVSTSSRANVGGMIGNNSAGVRSIRYGKTVDHVLELSVVLSTGETLTLRRLNATELEGKCGQKDREGELYRSIRQLVSENREEIQKRYPKVMRRVGGYNLDELLDENRFNLAKLMVGSEGTLAFVTEARLNLEPIPGRTVVSVLHFDDLLDAIATVPTILRYRPSAVEIVDSYGLELARSNREIAPQCAQFVQGTPRAILLVEFSGETETEIRSAWSAMKSNPDLQESVYAFYDAWEAGQKQVVWNVRKHALGVLLGMRGDAKPLPFIEDSGIPVEHLSQYIGKVLELCQGHHRPVALYAHASAGVIHVRPILNLKQPEDVEIFRSISARTFELVRQYGGSWSGEHGDGLVRSYKNREFFGDQLYQAFRKLKQTFDPLGLMNPGKIVDAQEITENLRINPEYRAQFPTSHYRFELEQGFDRAVEMCTGVGHCRKTLSGTMCPSYMATRDEEHSTRGRANALRMAMSGKLGPGGLASPRLYQVLDLCLECKACKAECPSNVDMARLKSEFLAHYYREHGLPLDKRLFGAVRRMAERGSRAPRIANLLLGSSLSRWLLEQLSGIDRRRKPPPLARRTFRRWFTRHGKGNPAAQPMALFVDTFTDFYEPGIGMAAVQLLDRLGFRVVRAEAGCCGRPLISTGQLSRLKSQAADLVQRLQGLSQQQIPIVVLEPSCLATLRDDFPDLVENQDRCLQVVNQLFSLEEFLTSQPAWDRLVEKMGSGPARILFHGHCQQKALFGTQHSAQVLQTLRETVFQEIDSGCCGMAGSFGYEKNHYEISHQIGELRLFPAIRNAPPGTELVAPGFSCRTQIRHFTGQSARHPAEVLNQYLSG